MTYDDLIRHIGEPQTTGVKIDDAENLVTVFRWSCGCRAYDMPDHIEIERCATHTDATWDFRH